MEQLINEIYNFCTLFVINAANLMGISYYEVNALIFVMLWPLISIINVFAFIYFGLKLIKLKRGV